MRLVSPDGYQDIHRLWHSLCYQAHPAPFHLLPSLAIPLKTLRAFPGWLMVARLARERWLITLHPTRARAALIDELLGTFQYFPSFVHWRREPLTRFLSTVPIESDDHKLIAIIKQTTSCDGSLRYPLLNTICIAKSLSDRLAER